MHVYVSSYSTFANNDKLQDILSRHGQDSNEKGRKVFFKWHGCWYEKGCLGIWETADLLGFPTQPPLGFTENGLNISGGSSVGQNDLLMPDVRGEQQATVTQIIWLQLMFAEEHLWMHNHSNLEADGAQQQKTTSCVSPFSYKKETEATIHTRSPILNNRILEKHHLVRWVLISLMTLGLLGQNLV